MPGNRTKKSLETGENKKCLETGKIKKCLGTRENEKCLETGENKNCLKTGGKEEKTKSVWKQIQHFEREARGEMFTTPGLVTTRRSILGPPAKDDQGLVTEISEISRNAAIKETQILSQEGN